MHSPLTSRTHLLTRSRCLGMVWTLLTAVSAFGCTAMESKKKARDGASAGPQRFSFGRPGSAPGELSKPDGIGIDPAGNIWIVDAGNHRIQVFGPRGKHRLVFGTRGIGPGKFLRLDGILLHGADVIVTDLSQHRLQVFDLQGHFKRFITFTGAPKGETVNPIAVQIYRGELYVVDPVVGCIYVSDDQGRVKRQIGQRGTGKADLLEPESIAMDALGRLWVADEGNSRVQIFERSGRHVTSIGPQITSRFYFSGDLEGLACDGDDRCYVVDEAAGYVVAFNLQGDFKFYLGAGRGRGPSQVYSPDGLAYDARRKRVVVSDQGNHRVQVFSTLGPRKTAFPALKRRGANTKPFVIAKVESTPSRAIRQLMPLARYFGLRLSDLGFTGGKVVVVTDYKQLAKRLRQETIHLFVGSGYATMLAAATAKFTPLAIGKKKGRWLYQALIVVREDTGIRDVRELVGKTMASENRFSTSTFILPRIMLERAGLMVIAADALTIPPNSVKIKFTREELSAVWWMTRKGLEGGFFADTDYAKIKKHVPLRVLQRSEKIPRILVSVRSSQSSELNETILKILGHLTKTSHRSVLAPLKVSQFRRISPEELSRVRSLKDALK